MHNDLPGNGNEAETHFPEPSADDPLAGLPPLPPSPDFTDRQWRQLTRQQREYWRDVKHERRRREELVAATNPQAANPQATATPASGTVNHSAAKTPGHAPSLRKTDAGRHAIVGTPFVDVAGRPLNIVNQYRGASLFLILSGPSINRLDLSQLNKRGLVAMGVNNSPAIFRPLIWSYVDNPRKFVAPIWQDAGVLKSVPKQHLRKNRLSEKCWPGKPQLDSGRLFGPMPSPVNPNQYATPADMPGVFGHVRNANFDPDNWLSEASINWGNSKKSAKRNGHPHVLNVMFCAIKHAYALGFRTVYLLGCDFHMDERKPYAFEQKKSGGGVDGNNRVYRKMDDMFRLLRPNFDEARFRVLNCNHESGLTAFDFCDFDTAVKAASHDIQQDPIDTAEWYDLEKNY